MEPTPRPWRAQGAKVLATIDGRECVVANMSFCTETNDVDVRQRYIRHMKPGEVDANAELIARAVNAHEALVAALGRLVEMCDYLKEHNALREPQHYDQNCPYEPTTEGLILAAARAALNCGVQPL